MDKQAREKDEWAPLIDALRRGKHYTKGGVSTWDEAVPLAAIDRTAPVQFREHLSEETLERMDATLENGGKLAAVILVEAVREEGAGADGPTWRTFRPEDSMRCYLTGDGNHRIEVTERRHWQRAREAEENHTGSPEEFANPQILAVVIKGAPDPLALAREINVRLNALPPTPPTENERQCCAFVLHELHPDWGVRTIARVVGYQHPTVRNLFNRQEVRADLERCGVAVPSNAILEVLHGVDRYAWEELAKTIAAERWRASDLKAAIGIAARIGETDWNHVRDAGGEDVDLNTGWQNLPEAQRVRLAYHYCVTQGLPDEQVVWAAHWLSWVQGSDDRDSKQEARDILTGKSSPDSWGWTPPQESEPDTTDVISSITSQPEAPGSGTGQEPEVVPGVLPAPVRPAPAAGNGKEEGQAPASPALQRAVQRPTKMEEELLAQCRELIAALQSGASKLEERRATLARLGTDEDRAALRAVAQVLADLERSLRFQQV